MVRSIDVDVVIVGAGFAGMYMLHRARGLGVRARVIEAGSDVGGTWYWNRYPGARCDIESMEYSYGFDPELQQEWDWTERYATQPEILRYAGHVADRFDLRRDITFDDPGRTARTSTTSTSTWRVTTDAGERIEARFVVMATGCLSAAITPDFPGMADYRGRLLHTGQWPHEPVDFTGERVAVIGTGSSGVQSIPIIAEQAAHLTVLQRTPNYAVPAHNRPLDPAEQAAAEGRLRGVPGGQPSDDHRGRIAVADERRGHAHRRSTTNVAGCWRSGGRSAGCRSSACSTTSSSTRPPTSVVAEFVRDKIREVVHDPVTAAKLTPTT